MSVYVTKQGDMWDTIAYKVTGSTACTDKLIAANSIYRDVFEFPAGIQIFIPDFAVDNLHDALPPWKKAKG